MFLSRGTVWGEDGYIRLARFGMEPQGEPCYVDITPLDGIGCAGDTTKIMTVCGAAGILTATAYATGAALV